MNNTNLRVEIVDPKANVNEDFPYEIVNQPFTVLFLYVSCEVSMLAVFHDDVDFSIVYERIMVANYEMRVKFCEKFNLLHRLESGIGWEFSCVNLFYDVVSVGY